jgi:hypothetical protein
LLAAVAAIIRSEARLRGSRPYRRADLAEDPGGTLVIRERVEGRSSAGSYSFSAAMMLVSGVPRRTTTVYEAGASS